jgi:aryl-alcohol dehydrogenase-like predicted oxidoreductase
VGRVKKLTDKRGATASQIAPAWMLHKHALAAPIVGASKMQHLEEAVGAVRIELDEAEIKTW